MNPLVYWAKEREEIRKKKEAGLSPPWTDDQVLQTYRFCNLRRRDDRVSRWLLEFAYTEEFLAKLSPIQIVVFVAFCRQINWPPTLKVLLADGYFTPSQEWNYLAIGKRVDSLAMQQKVWTGAYLIRAQPGFGGGKGVFVSTQVAGALISHKEAIVASLRAHKRRGVWAQLLGCKNWGAFSAGQLVDDLTWTPLLRAAEDIYTWAPQGPGSLRGYNRVLGLPLKTKHNEEEWCAQLQAWRGEIIKALGPGYDDLTLHDVQSCLCELDKYLRVKNGEGRPRSRYTPETAY